MARRDQFMVHLLLASRPDGTPDTSWRAPPDSGAYPIMPTRTLASCESFRVCGPSHGSAAPWQASQATPSERDLLRRTRHVARRAAPVARGVRDPQDLRHALAARIHQRLVGARVLVRHRPAWRTRCPKCGSRSRPSGVGAAVAVRRCATARADRRMRRRLRRKQRRRTQLDQELLSYLFTGRSIPPPARSPAPRPPRSRGTVPSGSPSPPAALRRPGANGVPHWLHTAVLGLVSRRARGNSASLHWRGFRRLRTVFRGRRRGGRRRTRRGHHLRLVDASAGELAAAARLLANRLAPPPGVFPSAVFCPPPGRRGRCSTRVFSASRSGAGCAGIMRGAPPAGGSAEPRGHHVPRYPAQRDGLPSVRPHLQPLRRVLFERPAAE